MDKAALLMDILRRNALRRQAQLPLLDVRAELAHACGVAQLHEWQAFRATHKDVLNRLRADVLAELRQQHGPHFPNNYVGALAVERLTNERFTRFAQTQGMRQPGHGRNTVTYGSIP